jgi:hypothetical protein
MNMTSSSTQAAATPNWLALLANMAITPRTTMRWILDHLQGRAVHTLALLVIVAATIGDIHIDDIRRLGAHGALFATGVTAFMIAVTIGAGLSMLYLFGWLGAISGRFLEGNASAGTVRTVLAWGGVPFIWALLYRIPAAIFWTEAYGSLHSTKDLWSVKTQDVTLGASWIPLSAPLHQVLILASLDLLVLAWYLTVTSRALAEAQGFSSSWQGFGNLMLAFALPILAIVIVTMAVALA